MTNKELIKNLKELKNLAVGGRPQESWRLASKELLLRQIDPLVSSVKQEETPTEAIYYWEYFSNLISQRVLKPAVAVFVALAMVLSYTAVVSVANASLPGDMFYPVKTAGEKVQLALTFGDDKKVALQMNFVNRRIDELHQIVQQAENDNNKGDKIIQTVQKISEDIKSVKNQIGRIDTQTKPELMSVVKLVDERTLQIKEEIAKVHSGLAEDVKQEVAQDIKEAIDSTERASENTLEVIVSKYQGGDKTLTDEEVATRLAERIKLMESTLVAGLSSRPTSTEAVIGSANNNLDSALTLLAKIIEEAKNLLDKNDFAGVLLAINGGRELVNQISGQNANSAGPIATSSSDLMDLNLNISSSSEAINSSTEAINETTDSILKTN